MFDEAEMILQQQASSNNIKQQLCQRWNDLINNRIKPHKSHFVRDIKDGVLYSSYASCLWKSGKVEKKLRRKEGKWESCFIHSFDDPGIQFKKHLTL